MTMAKMIELVRRLEAEYGSPPANIPKDDPNYLELRRDYWTGKTKKAITTDRKSSKPCRVTHLKSGVAREFNTFSEAAEAYHHNASWLSNMYKLPNHANSKYKVELLEDK